MASAVTLIPRPGKTGIHHARADAEPGGRIQSMDEVLLFNITLML